MMTKQESVDRQMSVEPQGNDVLWQPRPDSQPRVKDYLRWLASREGLYFDDYASLWEWSVTHTNDFWLSIWRYFELTEIEPSIALEDASMPGAVWFPDTQVNYAEVLLRMPGRGPDDEVVIARSQSRPDVRLTADGLRDQVARARAGLVRAGVVKGDRVAAYAPNIPETLVLMLASASLGAIFSSCAPEFGTKSVIDRWQQIAPKVLLVVDGYCYGKSRISRRDEVAKIRQSLPSVELLVSLPYLDQSAEPFADSVTWTDFTSELQPLAFVPLDFADPLYILFSSGTTGLPKPIVHCHGGIAVEHVKALALHLDLGPDDRFFWFSTTGWMMWNFLVSGLAVGSTIVMFDGNPSSPDSRMLWEMSGDFQITYFGTSAPYLLQCRKDGIVPREVAELSSLRGVGSTGAPLPKRGFRWVYENVSETALLSSTSGGTDVCAPFVGMSPLLPVLAGEISCRILGCAVVSYDQSHSPVIDQTGELVITQPMPSMPVGFWGDDSGEAYRAAYFEDIPGVWRHGDWIEISGRGTCIITGRSDATLNRGGVRLGTSEFYAVAESHPSVVDSLVIHLEDDEGGSGKRLLLVVLKSPSADPDQLRVEISRALRDKLSPRHVPDQIHFVEALPHTLSGKKIEVPIKKILQGAKASTIVSAGALDNATPLAYFEALYESGLL